DDTDHDRRCRARRVPALAGARAAPADIPLLDLVRRWPTRDDAARPRLPAVRRARLAELAPDDVAVPRGHVAAVRDLADEELHRRDSARARARGPARGLRHPRDARPRRATAHPPRRLGHGDLYVHQCVGRVPRPADTRLEPGRPAGPGYDLQLHGLA